jgi:hypothetical protein
MKCIGRVHLAWVLLIAVMVLGCAAFGKVDTEIQTSVCQIATYGKKQDGERVRLRAVYISDIVERTMLKDKGCPNLWLGLAEGEIGADDKSVVALEEAVRGDIVNDAELRQFVVDISALYRSKGTGDRALLYITKVWSFRRIHGDWRNANLDE